MPTTVQVKFKDGSTQIVKIPVEVWKRNKTWTFPCEFYKKKLKR